MALSENRASCARLGAGQAMKLVGAALVVVALGATASPLLGADVD
jgi:hypothetical protein